MSRKTVEKRHGKTAFLSADTLVDTWVIFIIILVMNEEVRFHMKKATSQDVAALAGVSQATVSLILNNSSKITFSSETRERVLAAAQQLNYHLPARKKASAQAGSRMLLVLTPTLTNQYYSEIIQTIEQYADSLDYRVIVCNTFRKPELEKFYLNTFVDAHVDGIIYTFLPSFPRLVEKIADTLPTVLIGEKQDELSVCSIELRNVAAGALLAEHLCQLGHRGWSLSPPPSISSPWRAASAWRASAGSWNLMEFGMVLRCSPPNAAPRPTLSPTCPTSTTSAAP